MNLDELFTAINLEAMFNSHANRAYWYNTARMWVVMSECLDEFGMEEVNDDLGN